MLTIKEVYQFILLKFFLINIYLYITYILPTDGKIANLTFFRLTHMSHCSLTITVLAYALSSLILSSFSFLLMAVRKKLFFINSAN